MATIAPKDKFPNVPLGVFLQIKIFEAAVTAVVATVTVLFTPATNVAVPTEAFAPVAITSLFPAVPNDKFPLVAVIFPNVAVRVVVVVSDPVTVVFPVIPTVPVEVNARFPVPDAIVVADAPVALPRVKSFTAAPVAILTVFAVASAEIFTAFVPEVTVSAPVNAVGPGFTVKLDNIPEPPAVDTQFAKLFVMLVKTYTALVDL